MSLTENDLALIEAVQECKTSDTDDSIDWKRVTQILGQKSVKHWKTYWLNEVLPKLDAANSLFHMTTSLSSSSSTSQKRKTAEPKSAPTKRTKKQAASTRKEAPEVTEASFSLELAPPIVITQTATTPVPPNTPLSASDYSLIDAMRLFGEAGRGRQVDWDSIIAYVGGTDKTKQELSNYWHESLKPRLDGVIIEPWTEDEDRALSAAVEKLQSSSDNNKDAIIWSDVAKEMPNKSRSAEQCESRWKVVLEPQLNGSRLGTWSAEEDALLREGIALYGKAGRGGCISWTRVAKHMRNIRSAQQCRDRWRFSPRAMQDGDASKQETSDASVTTAEETVAPSTASLPLQPTSKPLTPSDYALIDAIQRYTETSEKKYIDWDKVIEYMGGSEMTRQQLSQYWNQYLKPRHLGIVTEPWTPEEDEALNAGAEKYRGMGHAGGIAWEMVVKEMPRQRSAMQCHTRWNKFVEARLKGARTGKWTAEEDALLREAIDLYGTVGPRGGVSWKLVSEHMGHKRSSHQCSNRWNFCLKDAQEKDTNKKISDASTNESAERCQ